jgi:ribokinase
MSDLRGLAPVEEDRAADVVVVGSINVDVSVVVDRFPNPGETVRGAGLHRGGGGKGANQAVAAARLGRSVALVGRVGRDDAQSGMRTALADQGVDVDLIATDPEQSTGLALIEVDRNGENRIVVVPGANGAVSSDDLDRAADTLAAAGVVLTQLEVPVTTVEALARRPRRGLLILNPAPAAEVDLAGFDLVVPNRTELALLAKSEPVELHPLDELVDRVMNQVQALTPGPEAVIVTLGGAGVVVVQGLRSGEPAGFHIPAVPVDVVDTTGAGDAFCGALADALCLGSDVIDAATWANRVAALAVTRRGAWPSLPTRADVVR